MLVLIATNELSTDDEKRYFTNNSFFLRLLSKKKQVQTNSNKKDGKSGTVNDMYRSTTDQLSDNSKHTSPKKHANVLNLHVSPPKVRLCQDLTQVVPTSRANN